MLKKKSTIFLYVFLIIVLSACNLPSGQNATEEVSDLALTVTAQALLLQNSPTPEFTATPQFTETPGASATPSVPQVTVSTNTNCRTGPSTQYDNVDSLLVGQTATVVGKSSSTGYWIINRINGSGTCWLFPQYATVSGNTAALPEYPIPPTPTPTATSTPTATPTLAPPAAVSNVTVSPKICNPINPPPLHQYGGVLNWSDESNNESGFNIYYNGGLFHSTAANVTSHPLPLLPFNQGIPQTWGVEAFNAAGKAAIKTVVFTCP